MITIDKLKKNFGEKVAVDIEHYEINQSLYWISEAFSGAAKLNAVFIPASFTVFEISAIAQYPSQLLKVKKL